MSKTKPKVRRQMLTLFCALLLFGQILRFGSLCRKRGKHEMVPNIDLICVDSFPIIHYNKYNYLL